MCEMVNFLFSVRSGGVYFEGSIFDKACRVGRDSVLADGIPNSLVPCVTFATLPPVVVMPDRVSLH